MKIEPPRLLPTDADYAQECEAVIEGAYLEAKQTGRFSAFLAAVKQAGWLPEAAADAIVAIEARNR